MKNHLKGVITALITPFIDQKLNEKGLIQNIHFQIENGVNGILPLGTTGEAPTLTFEEHEQVIKIAVKEAKGKVPVWVGTGSYSTLQTIEKTKKAKDLGADVALIVTPYYNKPTQEGIYRHFEAISQQTNIPIVVYNIAGRTCSNVETATLKRIAELPNVVGVKESSGSISQASDVVGQLSNKSKAFSVLSGDDEFTLPMMALGATGVVSVVSNLVPAKVVALIEAALKGDFQLARQLHYELLPLFKGAFLETNPVPIKTAMNMCSLPAGSCRLPLYRMMPDNEERLRQILLGMNLIVERK